MMIFLHVGDRFASCIIASLRMALGTVSRDMASSLANRFFFFFCNFRLY